MELIHADDLVLVLVADTVAGKCEEKEEWHGNKGLSECWKNKGHERSSL